MACQRAVECGGVHGCSQTLRKHIYVDLIGLVLEMLSSFRQGMPLIYMSVHFIKKLLVWPLSPMHSASYPKILSNSTRRVPFSLSRIRKYRAAC